MRLLLEAVGPGSGDVGVVGSDLPPALGARIGPDANQADRAAQERLDRTNPISIPAILPISAPPAPAASPPPAPSRTATAGAAFTGIGSDVIARRKG